MHGQVKTQSKWRDVFLHHVSRGRPESIAADAAGVNRSRIIQEKQRDESFAAEIAKARQSRSKGTRW